ncbi:MAG: hypothetical protein AB7S74_09495 [Hyphomicrobium sp.]
MGMMPEDRPKQTSRVILSIPLTTELKADLERRAGRQPVSAYARKVLFPANDNAPPKKRIARHDRKDRQAFATVLARLGAMEVSGSVQELARLARLGALPMTPEVEAALQQACADIAAIKALLMKALGLRKR